MGSAAVALPVLFHLIRRHSREKVQFSSLMFLKPFPPKVNKRSRLTDLLLLALRCLVLCLLALGFARPYFHKGDLQAGNAGRGRRLLLLIDTSASMRRGDLWAQAKTRALAIAKASGPDDQVALFSFDRNAHSVMGFADWAAVSFPERFPLLVSKLESLEPGWNSSHLGKALITASENLVESANREANQNQLRPLQLCVISDLQEGSRLDGLSGYEWPRGLTIQVETVKAANAGNAGIQPAVEGAETPSATNNQAKVRIFNSVNSRREQFQVQWQGAAGPGASAYVPPGQSRVVSAPPQPAGQPKTQLVLSGDDEPFDNTCYLLPAKAREAKILYSGAEAETDSAQALYYLTRAFQNYRRHNLRLVKAAGSAEDLVGAQFGIATSLGSQVEGAKWREFAASGRTALVTLSPTNSQDALKALLGVQNLSLEEADGKTYAMLGAIDFDHPIFAPFKDPRYNDFTKIHFWRHRRLSLEGLTNAVALARFDNGDPALIQVPAGAGNLLILASGWTPGESQLALSSKFVPLLYSILEFGGVIREFSTQHTVGEAVDLTELGKGNLAIGMPDGATRQAEGGRFIPESPGIYTVIGAAPPFQFAVNLDPSESRVAPLDIGQLQNLGVPLKGPEKQAAKADLLSRQNRMAAELEASQKNWRLFLLAALGFLLIETVAGGWRRQAVAAA